MVPNHRKRHCCCKIHYGGDGDDAADEIGLYDDLNYVDLGELVSKLENDKEILSKQIKTLEGDVEKLASELTCMKETEKSLSRNISELYKTAKTEIERKDRMINSLRAEKDNLLFRRFNRATEERQINDFGNTKRNKQEAVEENPSKRRKCENEPHAAKSEAGRHSPRRTGSSDSRRHSSYSRDNHRHKDSAGGSSRRNHGNDSNDRNRSRYHTKGEGSEHKNESSDKNKFKHNSVTKQDLTRGKERDRNENTGDFRKTEGASSERKRKEESSHKSSTEKVNGPSNTNTPSKGLQPNTRNLADDCSSKPMDRDNSSHLKSLPKVEDKSSVDSKKGQSMKPFSFFDKTLSPTKDKILPSLPLAMDCEDQLNSKNSTEPKKDKINSTDARKEQKIPPKSSSIQENEILISPRHDNLMNYLEIKPIKGPNAVLSKDEKLVSADCENKLKSKTSTQEKSGFSKEEKGKSKVDRKRNATTSKASNGRNRSEKENKSDSNHTARSKNYDKSFTRKHESKEKRKKRVNVIIDSGSEEQEDPVNLNNLCEERERLKRVLEQLGDSEEDDNRSGEETSSLEADDAKVTFLANVHISPVIKAKKGATNRLQECIEKLGERESNANNVVTSNENPEQDNNKIVPTKNENAMEVTSSYIDVSIGSPTSSSNQIISKRTPRLANLIDKLSGKEQNCSRYDVFAESANEIAHSTLKINDCQLSSTNTTIMDENSLAQPGTSAMNNSKVLPKLLPLNNEIIANQPTVKPLLPSLETTTNNSAGMNLVRSLETSNTITKESNSTNNNSAVLEKSKTASVDPNISSSSEHLNNSNSTIVLNSSLSLNNSSENGSSVRTVFNNRRRRCVVKIVN